jgi:DNA ligase-1
MLPQVYDESIDVRGWLMSEKLDGVRGYWDGEKLLSKNGNQLYPPPEFTKNFPPFPIEGELWGGRESFQRTVSIVSRSQPHQGWLQLQFCIFDVPKAPGPFLQRLKKLKQWFSRNPSAFAYIIPQTVIAEKAQLKKELQRIEDLGGEGLIVRKADTLYTSGRSADILKVKSFLDAEATVISHLPGKGRNHNRLGSLLVELPNKTQFKIGSGFSDEERIDPPPIGSIVSFKYYGLYPSGIPKFASYLRIRTDEPL